MTYLEAIVICKKLNTEEEELDCLVVGEAVQKILSMETINAVNKDTLLNIVRWCFPMIWEEVPAEGGRVMSECETCKHEGEICPSVSHYQGFCDGWEQKPITNADRIRSMTDEELAEWLGDMIYPECVCCPADNDGWCKDCKTKWLNWLKQEGE